jgi:hypothetical protein
MIIELGADYQTGPPRPEGKPAGIVLAERRRFGEGFAHKEIEHAYVCPSVPCLCTEEAAID